MDLLPIRPIILLSSVLQPDYCVMDYCSFFFGHETLPKRVQSTIHAIAAAAISLAYSFCGFWFCMVLMTTGELMLVPTASTSAANMAAVDMRGRYKSIYELTWGIASRVS